MKIRKVETPFTIEKARSLHAGDTVFLTGTVYTARDQAHKRMAAELARGTALPFDLRNAIIYYCGPTPARPGGVIGSCGPTTSSRMDGFTPALLAEGLRGMIGKGERGPEVIRAMRSHPSIYFAAVGGAGALLARHVTAARVIAYEDLGAEAIRELVVKDFPLIVAIDTTGKNLYKR